ncbi:unnamed protein product [Kuraishia capsulata CBS 1993]|uniref:Uncharacterized protein n=1 Tax=Kuraishia capsulata CBS 1993 TaxID=1382522 RepID=W6MJB5_9ASCO|nr:uncharacterized protein KUCA_T00002019001 [Kuraishia capsulata CBS 1993]CDK26048.1 unnamed protein product [Kuraishia capsulata CBS 1993]
MSVLPLGGFIYAAVKPIIRIYLLMATGYFLAKYDLMSVESARAVSDLILMVFMPALTFAKVVTNLDIRDIKTIGVIILTAVLMYSASAAFAFVNVFFLTPVPKRWRGGALSAGIMQNAGDLPIAYLQNIAGGLIFTEDEGDKGVAYVIIFLAVYVVVQFNCGLFQLVEYDFKKEAEDLEREAAESARAHEKELQEEKSTPHLQTPPTPHNEALDATGVPISPTSTLSSNGDDDDDSMSIQTSELDPRPLHSNELVARKLHSNVSTATSRVPSARGRPSADSYSNNRAFSPGGISSGTVGRSAQSISHRRPSVSSTFLSAVMSNTSRRTGTSMDDRHSQFNDDDDLVREYSRAEPFNQNITTIASMVTQSNLTKKDILESGKSISFVQKYHLHALVFVLKNFQTPNSIALVSSLIIALIPWLKALFVNTGSVTLSQAPDDNPALSFILDYATYASAPCVPLGLIMLGATIARLKIKSIPKGFWKCLTAHTLFRLCVLPIIGIAWVGKLSRMKWITDDISKFVSMLQFGLPSATVQVYLTASNMRADSPSHLQMDCLALYIIAQYSMLVVSMPILVTYVLKDVLHK